MIVPRDGVDRQELAIRAVEQMQQVILNLALNALEALAAENGQVTLDVHRHGPWVELSVIDNGCGITAQTLERVFEPFFTEKRGAGSHGAGSHGTGLGLSISHAIVRNHGGSISAHSDGIGKGSRFTILLPPVPVHVQPGQCGEKKLNMNEQDQTRMSPGN